ncbi:hypothetical protein ACS0TY_025199 [Phlomoides rotata]
MDGYYQYTWNQDYNQNGMVYPLQHQEFGYDNGRNFDYDCQMLQVPFHYQEWGYNGNWSHAFPSNDFQPQHDVQPNQDYDPSTYSSSNEKPSTYEVMEVMIKKMDEFMKNTSTQIKTLEHQMGTQIKTLEHKMGQVASTWEQLYRKGEEDEEQKEEGPSEEKNKENDLNVEEGQEECPLMDMSDNEQENQEASQEELKSEMSISKPLNSSINILLDSDISIDFVLPLDSFDQMKELVRMLGILDQRRKDWHEMEVKGEEGRASKKICMKDTSDWSTTHVILILFEVQRMRYTGKEDQYPWPFR